MSKKSELQKAIKAEIAKQRRTSTIAEKQGLTKYGFERGEYSPPKRLTDASLRAAMNMTEEIKRRASVASAKKEDEEREKKEEEEGITEAEAETYVDNIKRFMASVLSTGIKKSYSGYLMKQTATEKSYNNIENMIEDAVHQWGVIETARALMKFSKDVEDTLEKLILAVVQTNDTATSEVYNTNKVWYKRDDAGSTGRERYRNKMKKLARELGVPFVSTFAGI